MNSKVIWLLTTIILLLHPSCQPEHLAKQGVFESPSFTWENATVYFLLTDRFHDGNPDNNYQHTSDNPPAPFRGYMGGDIKGITQKINDGYFTDLGVNAIWMTPVVEQIEGSVDEGTGNSFGFHGYWTRDWTALDDKFGTEDDLRELVETAHNQNIRILIDVVANHTGPVTQLDSQWPDDWVKTGPRCTYQNAETTINCTLVENLPDIRTEQKKEVALPDFLVNKWRKEGRYEEEVAELDQWFLETNYPRTPANYILKWLVDFIKKYGVDGFRVDTVKHTESEIWNELRKISSLTYDQYKKDHSDPVLDENSPFYMVGEVYNYFISNGRMYDYGDKKVDFFAAGFTSLINFDFKTDAHNNYEKIFSKYDEILHRELKGKSVLNYISSHDDGSPFDINREHPIEAGTKLLLCPGGVQIYYGDETARSLTVEAEGDAKLRSFMNWDELDENSTVNGFGRQEILLHWQKLGSFRNDNPAIGAGKHSLISTEPYTFSRSLNQNGIHNAVVVGLHQKKGLKSIPVSQIFNEGEELRDVYGEVSGVVKNGKINIDSPFEIVLLERIR